MRGRAVLPNGKEAPQGLLPLRPSIMRLCAVWCHRPGQDPPLLPVRRGRVRRAAVQAGLPHSPQGVPVPGPHVRLRAVHGLGLAAAAHHVPVRGRALRASPLLRERGAGAAAQVRVREGGVRRGVVPGQRAEAAEAAVPVRRGGGPVGGRVGVQGDGPMGGQAGVQLRADRVREEEDRGAQGGGCEGGSGGEEGEGGWR